MNVYDTASKLHNELLGICLDKYEEFSDALMKKKISFKYDPINSMLDTYDYTKSFKDGESDVSALKVMERKN